VKLYTYTMERSLPRMALKGMPAGFPLYGSAAPAAEMAQADTTEKDKSVVLEIDADGLDESMIVSGEVVEAFATMAQQDVENDPEASEAQAEEAYSKVYDEAEDLSSVEEMIEKFDVIESDDIIHPSRIKVLGAPEVEFPDDLEEEVKVSFEQKPMPLKSFSMPMVTRLLRSIFLPKHKLFGAGRRRGPAMGSVLRFRPDSVSGVTLVWAAGKTFRRGMRGAFGAETGDAIGQLVAMRAGQEPGKFLGSGARGAVYALGVGRVLKVTMDGNEVQAAQNLIGIRHPNLSFVHDVFIVTDGKKGAGIIVRDSVDTTLDKFDKKTSKMLDSVMDIVLESATYKLDFDMMDRIVGIDPQLLASEMDRAIDLLRNRGCNVDEKVLFDIADAFRELKHLGIVGIDFDAKNIGVIKKPSPRVLIFDYGMTKSPPVEVEVVSLAQTNR